MAVRYCAECGAPLEPGNKFCSECGTPVEAPEMTDGGSTGSLNYNDMISCPGCGTPTLATNKTCEVCGYDFGGSGFVYHSEGKGLGQGNETRLVDDGGTVATGAWVDPVPGPGRISTVDPGVRGVGTNPVSTGGQGGGYGSGGDRNSALKYVLVALIVAFVTLGGAGFVFRDQIFGGETTEEEKPVDEGSSGETETEADPAEGTESEETTKDEDSNKDEGSGKDDEQDAVDKSREKIAETTPAPPVEETPPQPVQTANTVQISIPGTDGTVRNETIRLDGNSERVFADSNSRVLTDDEISRLTDAELCIAWNEIIAVKGYVFKNEGLRNYFFSRSWYQADYNAAGDTNGLGEVAGINVAKLQAALRDTWWRYSLT